LRHAAGARRADGGVDLGDRRSARLAAIPRSTGAPRSPQRPRPQLVRWLARLTVARLLATPRPKSRWRRLAPRPPSPPHRPTRTRSRRTRSQRAPAQPTPVRRTRPRRTPPRWTPPRRTLPRRTPPRRTSPRRTLPRRTPPRWTPPRRTRSRRTPARWVRLTLRLPRIARAQVALARAQRPPQGPARSETPRRR